jgi:hypothetical protein
MHRRAQQLFVAASDGVCTAAACAFAALLPFHALGTRPFRRWLMLEPCLMPVVLASPWLVVAIWRNRWLLLRARVMWAVSALAFVALASELISFERTEHPVLVAPVPLLATSAVALAVVQGRARALLRATIVGGVACLLVSWVGYAAVVVGGAEFGHAFSFRSPHPVFDDLPRMTGTFGTHASWLGEYLIALLAASLVARKSGAARAAIAAAGASLLLTFSYAWIGAGVLVAALPWRRPVIGRIALALAFAAALLGAWLMLTGPRAGHAARPQPVPCSQLDQAHHVVRRTASAAHCESVVVACSGPRLLTHYRLAAWLAWEAFREAPILGVGKGRYGRIAERKVRDRFGERVAGFYRAPVGLVAAAGAYWGGAGLAAVAWLLWALWRERPRSSNAGLRHYAWWGTMALLAVAIQSDFVRTGPLWLLLGMHVGATVVPGCSRVVAEKHQAPASTGAAR